ncbi:MAG: fatty acyl-AMP ligase, partial [Gammaproteobacteria bacterium]|nr:fatty acyl-AMP ligase [Gammaproteobacteria bacterium]
MAWVLGMDYQSTPPFLHDECQGSVPGGAGCGGLVRILRARAEERAEQTAYVFLDDGESRSRQFSYADLDGRARAIAARLQAMGLAGQRALLLYPPGLEYVEAF